MVKLYENSEGLSFEIESIPEPEEVLEEVIEVETSDLDESDLVQDESDPVLTLDDVLSFWADSEASQTEALQLSNDAVLEKLDVLHNDCMLLLFVVFVNFARVTLRAAGSYLSKSGKAVR